MKKSCWNCASISIEAEDDNPFGWCERLFKRIDDMQKPICGDVEGWFRR